MKATHQYVISHAWQCETQRPLRKEEIKWQLSLLLSFFDVLYTLLTGKTLHSPLLLSCGLCCTVEMVKQTDSCLSAYRSVRIRQAAHSNPNESV